jgi:hypothetical protein
VLGLEVLETSKAYFRDHHVRLEVILVVSDGADNTSAHRLATATWQPAVIIRMSSPLLRSQLERIFPVVRSHRLIRKCTRARSSPYFMCT